MSKLLEGKLPCPREDCSSSDAYHIYEDGDWCYSCGKGTMKPKRPEDLEPKFTKFRGVSKETQERLGFLSYCDEDGKVLFREYPYDNGVSKFREVIPKKFWTTGKLPLLCGKHLWNAGSVQTICVVEGEEDLASFMEMSDLPVVSLSSASLGTDLREIHDYLNPFKKIVLCFESDEAGRAAKNKIGTMFPGRVFEASLTLFKDANDYLVNGKEKEFYWAVINAKLFTADFVFNTIADFEKILQEKENDVCVPTPFPTLNSLITGIPLGHVTLITGQEGLGKTEILKAIEYEFIANHPELPVSITHHEEAKADTLKSFFNYHTGRNAKSIEHPVPDDEILKVIEDLTKNNNVFLTEIGIEADSVKDIISRFDYLAKVCGVKVFFVDPINQFVPPDSGSDTNLTRFLDNLAISMAKFVVANNVACVWTSHVNDEGKTRDSRMISKACSIRLDIDRDHMSEDETIRNTTTVKVTKARGHRKTGSAGQWLFDTETHRMFEQELPF